MPHGCEKQNAPNWCFFNLLMHFPKISVVRQGHKFYQIIDNLHTNFI